MLATSKLRRRLQTQPSPPQVNQRTGSGPKSPSPSPKMHSISAFALVLISALCVCQLLGAKAHANATVSPANAMIAIQVATQTTAAMPPTQSTTAKPNYLETSRQITGILDRFMSLGYDKRVRPNYGGPPVEVNVTMRILSISSVSEVMMDFTADFYFRQTWHDPRLSFKKLRDIQTLYVGAEVSKKIWLPDTFFGNEKIAYFHEATTPNVFLRIDHSGEVYRSIRLTVTSSCPMNLQYFPMDRQRCTIEAESYGYSIKDIIYKWARKNTAVERDETISLPQFDIVQTKQKYRVEMLSSGTYSRLIAEIHFARRMGYYLIQIYIPSSLIVVISWVSFWLHRNASPARVQLGVTTVLTMTTLMSSTNAALPKISYVKSIDIFLGTCFIMVFAALLEYATVGYLGKRIAMRKAHAQHAQSQAQARALAQLQAQGAQGDSMPPTAGATLLADSEAAEAALAAAAAAFASSTHRGGGGGRNRHHDRTHNINHHLQQSPLALGLAPPARRSHSHSRCQCHSETPVPPPRTDFSRPLQKHYQSHCAHNSMHQTQSQNQNQNQSQTQTPAANQSQQKNDAALAAAATFVNLHRRNKGLPPSSNPNFAPFSWVGAPLDRRLDAIFGIRPSDIDKYSRVVFPVCFVCFQLMYWIVYLHISAFLQPDDQEAADAAAAAATSTASAAGSNTTQPS